MLRSLAFGCLTLLAIGLIAAVIIGVAVKLVLIIGLISAVIGLALYLANRFSAPVGGEDESRDIDKSD